MGLNLITLFDYPDDIRKVFPHDQAAMKVVYLAIEAAAKKWSMPVRNWKGALNRFMIEFPERMPETL